MSIIYRCPSLVSRLWEQGYRCQPTSDMSTTVSDQPLPGITTVTTTEGQ